MCRAGCDALAVHLLIAPLASSFNTRFDVLAVVATFAVQVLWIMSHWEEYHTGKRSGPAPAAGLYCYC